MRIQTIYKDCNAQKPSFLYDDIQENILNGKINLRVPLLGEQSNRKEYIEPGQKVKYEFSRTHKHIFFLINRLNIIHQIVSNC